MNIQDWAPTIRDFGLGTVAGALIAGIVAFVVAKVNANAARTLALDTAHRAYRTDISAPILKYSRAIARRHGQLRLAIKADSSWTGVFKATNALLDDTTVLAAEAGALYVADLLVQEAGNQLAVVLRSFETCILRARLSGRPKVVVPILEKHSASVHLACAAIELAVEAFVFGVSKTEREARERLEQCRTQLREATTALKPLPELPATKD